MPHQSIQFQWDIHEGGYEWIEARLAELDGGPSDPGPFLTDSRPVGAAGFAVTRYNPLAEHSGLFRVFADIDPTEDAIKAFADRYGLLGGEAARIIVLTEDVGDKKGPVGIGESLSAWHRELLAMSQAVTLWELARHGDVEQLSRFIHWDEKGVQYRSHPDLASGELPELPYLKTIASIASENRQPDPFDRFKRGEVIQPALYYVQRVVNKHLKERVSPRLLWNESRTHLGVYFVPGSLVGALWLQFAQAIERNNDFRKCAECGIWFELSPQTARSNKTYCSNACRTKTYRKRKAEAQRLHAEGVPDAEIAYRLGADSKTVKGWIAKSVPV